MRGLIMALLAAVPAGSGADARARLHTGKTTLKTTTVKLTGVKTV